jgi:hypothetical protein
MDSSAVRTGVAAVAPVSHVASIAPVIHVAHAAPIAHAADVVRVAARSRRRPGLAHLYEHPDARCLEPPGDAAA